MPKFNFFKDFFFFSKGERSGLVILSGLLLMMFALNLCIPHSTSHAEQFMREADSIYRYDTTLLATKHSYSYAQRQDTTNKKQVITPRESYPRRCSNTPRVNRPYEQAKKAYANLRIELNSADTTELKKLHGIGSKLSQRIVKYRTKLGGFSSKEQLRSVYGLSEETYQQIETHIWVDTTIKGK